MSTEESPLLASQSEVNHNAIYEKYSKSQKRIIVALVSWGGLVPFFVSSSFVPTIPDIAKDLHTTGATISLAVSLSILTSAPASMIWATYSGFYGRRPIYLVTMPCLALGSIAVGLANSVPELMVWRIIQAFGSSGGLSVGAAVIGDIYKLEERGSAMGIFFGACLLGPAIAPLIGGITARYASWRVMQYAIAAGGFIGFLLVLVLLPETSHPGARGVDKAPESKQGRWVWLNPFKSVWLLRSPNLMALVAVSFVTILADMVLCIPLAYTIGAAYNIENPAIIGAMFIPIGLGNLIGAPIAGRLSDYMVVKWRKRRNGKWVPEDRLRAAVVGGAVFVPGSLAACGLVTALIPGALGIVLNIILLFLNGVGVDLVLTPIAAYNVDVMHEQSAQLMSAHSGVRNLLLALVSTLIIPSITKIGVLWTNLITAALCWIGFGFLWATIKYGEQMRSWVDVGYSTIDST